MRQVAATVASYEIKTTVKVGDETETKTYTTKAVDIYKYDLNRYVINNYSSLSQSHSDAESMYKYAMEMLVNVELVVNEVDALIDAGAIEWGLTETNAVKKSAYRVIDSTLLSLKNELLEDRDEPTLSDTGDSEFSTETTYPVKPEEESDEDVIDTEKWEPSISRYPGLYGDDDRQSLDREALSRFINILRDNVKDDFRVTAEDRKLFDADDEKINKIINEKGISYVYPILADTHYFYYISGKNLERSQKISAMQEYLTDGVNTSDEEVQTSYTTLLNEQSSKYSSDVSAFDTAMKNNETVVYYPNDNYFYVKHILLPFSDEQKNSLTEYKARLNVTKEQINAFRDNLAKAIVCYKHVDGEDDKSTPYTVDQVMEVVKNKMLPLAVSPYEADRAFDDLIYLYNTDPGAFDNNRGYSVKYKLDEGESETYMEEFAKAAREMRDTLAVGQVYGEPVVTDYGVHIMYLASVTKPGAVSLNEYTTPGMVETYYDLIKEPIDTARENAAYTKWENEILTYNFNKYATLYEDRYKSFWES